MSDRVALVLVDFDDTLVNTAPRFLSARRELFDLMERLGFARHTAERLHHEEIDPIMRQRHGFGPFRLEHAFQETYRRLCEIVDASIDADVEEACRSLGRRVAGTPPCFDGAIDALRRLAAHHPTALYTQAADAQYQIDCVHEAGVEALLGPERVHVTERKTPDAFLHAIRRFGVEDPATVWMVGNSMRSDVNPALTVGARAILVESVETWEFDHDTPVSDDFVTVQNFPAAVDFLLSNGNH